LTRSRSTTTSTSSTPSPMPRWEFDVLCPASALHAGLAALCCTAPAVQRPHEAPQRGCRSGRPLHVGVRANQSNPSPASTLTRPMRTPMRPAGDHGAGARQGHVQLLRGRSPGVLPRAQGGRPPFGRGWRGCGFVRERGWEPARRGAWAHTICTAAAGMAAVALHSYSSSDG
jgi:hypothetical protein